MVVLMGVMLTSCASFGPKQVYNPSLPEIPADIRICFETTVAKPKAGPMDKPAVFKLIAALKKSEAAKTDCGKRLIQFYDNIQKGPA